MQVLDAGRLVEFGPPHELLQNPASYFCQLVDQSTPQAAARLRELAAEAYAAQRQAALTTSVQISTPSTL